MKPQVWTAAAAMLVMAGCAVGPKYARPDVPMTPEFKELPPQAYKETKEWKTAHPAQLIPEKWWEAFGDPQLNHLEEEVAAGNQDLKIAEARFTEARTAIRFNRSAKFPAISISPGLTSTRWSPNRPYFGGNTPATGDLLLPFDVSYEVDLWGRVRRSIASAREAADASAADLATVRLSIEAELAFDYFDLRSADTEQQLLNDTVQAYTQALQLTTNRFDGGAAPKSDVAQAQTQLETTRAQATDIAVRRAANEHAIAVLVGRPPASFRIAPAVVRMEPPVIPVGVPSQLLERRPDIASAERQVMVANEQIGLAKIAYYPTLLLSAALGLEGSSFATWFGWPSRFWAVGPVLAETLFDGGRRRAASEEARAAYDATVAGYRETTLTAFQQVEDNLAALRILEQESGEQHRAVVSSQEALQLFNNRYQGGVDSYLQVITAQTTALGNERIAIDLTRRRMEASVLLVKALGGGWDVSKLSQPAKDGTVVSVQP